LNKHQSYRKGSLARGNSSRIQTFRVDGPDLPGQAAELAECRHSRIAIERRSYRRQVKSPATVGADRRCCQRLEAVVAWNAPLALSLPCQSILTPVAAHVVHRGVVGNRTRQRIGTAPMTLASAGARGAVRRLHRKPCHNGPLVEPLSARCQRGGGVGDRRREQETQHGGHCDFQDPETQRSVAAERNSGRICTFCLGMIRLAPSLISIHSDPPRLGSCFAPTREGFVGRT
jgi:hypothetical protein